MDVRLVKVTAIINPVSGAGRTGKRLPEIQTLLRVRFHNDLLSFLLTAKAGDANNAASEAAATGSSMIIVAGGDGTIQEVVNGLMRCRSNSRPIPILGIINTGTGCGFAQSLGLPVSIENQMAVLATGRRQMVDVGKVTYLQDGREVVRYFVNECQAGLGATVSAAVEHQSKRLGGFLSYGYAAMKETICCRAASYCLKDGANSAKDISLLGVMVANGSRTGGGMRLAPQACLSDGLLDTILVEDQSPLSRLTTFPRIYSGSHLSSPSVRHFRTSCLELTSSATVPLAADGEPLGTLPCRVEIVPAAIQVVVPHHGSDLE